MVAHPEVTTRGRRVDKRRIVHPLNGIRGKFGVRDAGHRWSIMAGRFRETAPMPNKPTAKRRSAKNTCACLTSITRSLQDINFAKPYFGGLETHLRRRYQ